MTSLSLYHDSQFSAFSTEVLAWPNRGTSADVQQGPISRILFRLRPCVNLFYCLLLITSPGFLYNGGGGWRLGMWPRQNFCTSWPLGAFLPRALFRPVLIKTEYLRECSASRVWPYMHQLRIMSLVKCWVCPALCFAALCSVISANAAPGELLRLCPGSSGRAPQ